MSVVTITLVGKPDCHLCDTARDVVTSVVKELGSSSSLIHDGRTEYVVEELSILDDPVLFARCAEEIPVVLINGRVHTIWRVGVSRFTTALLEASA